MTKVWTWDDLSAEGSIRPHLQNDKINRYADDTQMHTQPLSRRLSASRLQLNEEKLDLQIIVFKLKDVVISYKLH